MPARCNARTMDHFTNPRNVGVIEDADAVGQVGTPATGNMMQLHLRVRDGAIADARFRTFGCAFAIATSSVVTELLKGLPLHDARAVTRRQISEALDGLPPDKMHCAVLAERTIQAALDDYASRHRGAHLVSP